eukprot:181274_1
MQALSRTQHLCAMLTRSMHKNNHNQIKTILETLQSEIKDIRSLHNKDHVIKTMKKLSHHCDSTISDLSKSLLSKWNSTTPINLNKHHTTNSTSTSELNHNKQHETKDNDTNMIRRGHVYIASMQRTKKWPELRDTNGKLIKRINVTSGSANKINGESAKQVSPMYLGPVNAELLRTLKVRNAKQDDEEALLFENYWQYGKIFKELGHLKKDNKISSTWLKFRKKGYGEKKGHRHPKGTKTNEILYTFVRGSKEYNKYRYYMACSSYYFGEYMDYITSRKRVYCPMYEALVQQTSVYQELKRQVSNGMNVMILDFDGPKGETDNEKCLKITQQMLQQKVNDTSAPFGHGYVFAAMLANIKSSEYCQM